MLKAARRSAADEVMLSYENGELIIDAGGASASVPASGNWNGVASVRRSVLGTRTSFKDGPVEFTVTADGRVQIGPMTVDARWTQRPKPQLDLILEATLAELLRLRITHSDEELLTAGVLKRVAEAERERDSLIASASDELRRLGDFRAAIREMVEAAIRRTR